MRLDSTGTTVKMPLAVNDPQEYSGVYTTAASLPPIPGLPTESIFVGILLGLAGVVFIRSSQEKLIRCSD